MLEPLVFATSNTHKFAEAKSILIAHGITLVQAAEEVTEIQTDDISRIVERKAKEAFKTIGRPLFVEHTSLHLDYLNGFPAGHTRMLIHYFGDQKVCELFGSHDRNSAKAVTTIGYCDSKRVHQFFGTLAGRIALAPRGGSTSWGAFGFNRIFIADGTSQTLSEMGADAKNAISMRKMALDKLVAFITGGSP